jgi:hypothetical protein
MEEKIQMLDLDVDVCLEGSPLVSKLAFGLIRGGNLCLDYKRFLLFPPEPRARLRPEGLFSLPPPNKTPRVRGHHQGVVLVGGEGNEFTRWWVLGLGMSLP